MYRKLFLFLHNAYHMKQLSSIKIGIAAAQLYSVASSFLTGFKSSAKWKSIGKDPSQKCSLFMTWKIRPAWWNKYRCNLEGLLNKPVRVKFHISYKKMVHYQALSVLMERPMRQGECSIWGGIINAINEVPSTLFDMQQELSIEKYEMNQFELRGLDTHFFHCHRWHFVMPRLFMQTNWLTVLTV